MIALVEGVEARREAEARWVEASALKGKARGRALKRIWNEQADLSYFNDSDSFVAVHHIGLFDAQEFGVEKMRRYFAGGGVEKPSRVELSALGYDRSKFRELGEELLGEAYIVFDKQRVTFASTRDVFSETIKVDAGDMKRFSKRPSQAFVKHIVLDRDEAIGAGEIGECFIDQWTVRYMVVKADRQKEIDFLRSLGVEVYARDN